MNETNKTYGKLANNSDKHKKEEQFILHVESFYFSI